MMMKAKAVTSVHLPSRVPESGPEVAEVIMSTVTGVVKQENKQKMMAMPLDKEDL